MTKDEFIKALEEANPFINATFINEVLPKVLTFYLQNCLDSAYYVDNTKVDFNKIWVLPPKNEGDLQLNYIAYNAIKQNINKWKLKDD